MPTGSFGNASASASLVDVEMARSYLRRHRDSGLLRELEAAWKRLAPMRWRGPGHAVIAAAMAFVRALDAEREDSSRRLALEVRQFVGEHEADRVILRRTLAPEDAAMRLALLLARNGVTATVAAVAAVAWGVEPPVLPGGYSNGARRAAVRIHAWDTRLARARAGCAADEGWVAPTLSGWTSGIVPP